MAEVGQFKINRRILPPMQALRLRRAARGFILLVTIANIVRFVRDPRAVRDMGILLAVLAGVVVVGTVVALILVGIRRLSGESDTPLSVARSTPDSYTGHQH